MVLIQTGRPVSSKEATWCIFSFAIHERHIKVIHLSVFLENGLVYFNPKNVVDKAERPLYNYMTCGSLRCLKSMNAKTYVICIITHI